MVNVVDSGTVFGEDGQTFYVVQTSPGVINFGYGGYTTGDIGLPEWSGDHLNHPEGDNKDWNASPYRVCCTAIAWAGNALVLRAMGLKDNWDHDAYFDYVDRYMVVVPKSSWTRQWDQFTEDMWDQYRLMY